MKRVSKFIYTMTLILLHCLTSRLIAIQDESPITHLNFSLWSEYRQHQFDGLTQEKKTEKLRKIFQDKHSFIEKHGIRRLIVKILDPLSFCFFHPDYFTLERDDNFYYWASQLTDHVEIEALFDCSPFELSKRTIGDHLANYYDQIKEYFTKQDKPFGAFKNIIEKMEWVSQTNEIYDADSRNHLLIAGITLDPTNIGSSEIYYQNLVNAFDQYRFQPISNNSVPNWIPTHTFFPIRTAIILPLDMKDFALANASSFPMGSQLKAHPLSQGTSIVFPPNFPSTDAGFTPPVWRPSHKQSSLLDTIYLQISDRRLTPYVYQNYTVLPLPHLPTDVSAIDDLCDYLYNTFHGIPFAPGPGYITNLQGTTTVLGHCTFFRTGGANREGQFTAGQILEVRPPYSPSPIRRTITEFPLSNREMQISSTLSTTKSYENIEYWYTPIPCLWTTPMISENVRSKIYFVFSTAYESGQNKFLGNWCLENFMQLLENNSGNLGFIHRGLFRDLSGSLVPPHANLVISDFSTIPNGNPFPECNWNLGN